MKNAASVVLTLAVLGRPPGKCKSGFQSGAGFHGQPNLVLYGRTGKAQLEF